MEKTFNSAYIHLPTLRRVAQITNYHCGPAVLQMLLSYHGVYIDQDKITEAAGTTERIRFYGTNVPEMARATRNIAPFLQFWYKTESTISDLSQLVNIREHPVGVEWQGIFGEFSDGDNGHYSVLTHVDPSFKYVMVADPYEPFAGIDRKITTMQFESLWWDTNDIYDPQTGANKVVMDHRMMFIVTQKDDLFPEFLGMDRG